MTINLNNHKSLNLSPSTEKNGYTMVTKVVSSLNNGDGLRIDMNVYMNHNKTKALATVSCDT